MRATREDEGHGGSCVVAKLLGDAMRCNALAGLAKQVSEDYSNQVLADG